MNAFKIGHLDLGRLPAVVGTVIKAGSLPGLAEALSPESCDLVEFRLDLIGLPPEEWLPCAQAIEHKGFPVLATLRSAFEGGAHDGDADRQSILQRALQAVSCIDIEGQSAIRHDLLDAAASMGKAVVVSHHNFEKTPGLSELQEVLADLADRPNALPKIATHVRDADDLGILKALLAHDIGRPKCIIGMGDAGRETRLGFPALGSCLTYGFLDAPGAPGQFAAPELVAHVASSLPAYAAAR